MRRRCGWTKRGSLDYAFVVRYEVVTFDCYGTLIDWEDGITRAFRETAGRDGVRLDDAAVLAAYAEIEPAIEARGYRSYREVLGACVVEVGARLGFRVAADRAGFLAESLAGWRPFPDTVPALERLAAAGYALGILSNVDDDLFAATRRALRVEFSIVVTAEQVRSYKPAPGHFLEARRRIGGRLWLHAARSRFHDVEPASALDIDAAWIRRGSARAAVPAGVEVFDDLARLADRLSA